MGQCLHWAKRKKADQENIWSRPAAMSPVQAPHEDRRLYRGGFDHSEDIKTPEAAGDPLPLATAILYYMWRDSLCGWIFHIGPCIGCKGISFCLERKTGKVCLRKGQNPYRMPENRGRRTVGYHEANAGPLSYASSLNMPHILPKYHKRNFIIPLK